MKLPDRFEVYYGGGGLWYWRYRARNGKIIADGAEGYSTCSNATRAARRFVKLIGTTL
jgi:uncharacterized protein YegP (UPF0339 family)